MTQSCAEAEQQLQKLLHRYPNCTALQFNAALAYDTFQMVDPAGQSQWRSRKRALLEEVRASGSGAYWQVATIQLATIAIADGELEQGETLLRELPERPGDPSAIWALYYLKKDQPEEALKRTQKQLYKLANQMVSCLATLMNPKLSPQPRQLLKICQAYQTMARTFGLPDMSVTWPDQDLFCPGIPIQKKPEVQSTSKPLRQMLLQAITTTEHYQPLFDCPVFAAALEKLKASV